MNQQLRKKYGLARGIIFWFIILIISLFSALNRAEASPTDKAVVGWFGSFPDEPVRAGLPDKPKKPGRLASRKLRNRPAAKSSTVNRKPAKRKPVPKETRANVRAKRAPSTLTMAIFGATYARVTVKDRQLSAGVYYLASGHGGPDPGAVGKYGRYLLAEDEYAYDVTIRLARVLLEHGATVYMIVQDPNDGIRDAGVLPIDYDEVAYPRQPIPRDQNARLKQSTTAVNNLYACHKKAYQRSVVIHVDSRSIGQNIDVFFYHHERSPAGKKLARHIHRTFNARYKRVQPTRAYLGTVSTRSSLYVVKNTTPPTVFIELGNIQNEKDQRRFVIADNRQALANWLYEGIRADYKSR